jgi:hypothetical protein
MTRRVAGRHGAHRRHELLRRRCLQQEAARPGAQRLIEVLVLVEGGQHHDAGVGALAGQRARCCDAVEVRHADVHQRDVGLRTAHQLDGLLAVGGVADHLEVALRLQDHAEPAAHDALVVCDGDPDAHSGRWARTR